MKVEIIKPVVNVVDFDKIVLKKTTTPSAYVMEYVCRVCYNSYDKITEDSHKTLLAGAAKRGHRSVFDFSNIQFDFKIDNSQEMVGLDAFFEGEKYLKHDVYETNDTYSVKVTGSIRAFIELLERYTYVSSNYAFVFIGIYGELCEKFPYIMKNWPTIHELITFNEQMWSNETSFNICRFTDIITHVNVKQDKLHRNLLVELITDRGLHNEIVRHRVFGHMAESQRYVRYGVNKNPLKVCIDSIRFLDKDYVKLVKENSDMCYKTYKSLLSSGYAPQIARAVLPMGTALKSFVYGSMENWEHFFRLRSSNDALPMAQEVSKEIMQQMINKRFF